MQQYSEIHASKNKMNFGKHTDYIMQHIRKFEKNNKKLNRTCGNYSTNDV